MTAAEAWKLIERFAVSGPWTDWQRIQTTLTRIGESSGTSEHFQNPYSDVVLTQLLACLEIEMGNYLSACRALRDMIRAYRECFEKAETPRRDHQ